VDFVNIGELLAQNTGSQMVLTLDKEHLDLAKALGLTQVTQETWNGEPFLEISGILTLIRVREGITLVGKVTATQRVACTMCLTEIPASWEVDFDQLFKHGPEDPEAYPIKDFEIDIAKPMAEAAMAAKPITLKCRPDCKGLCSKCGANLNDHPEHTH
jgi:uncharacterized metal-binding protein YceD (DUF177 family)